MPPALALFASLAVAADGPPEFVWLEGEAATPAAVGTAGRPESLSGRKWGTVTGTASWPLRVAVPGRYEVWVRAARPSPFRWRVAGRPWVDVPAAVPADLWPAAAESAVGWLSCGAIDLEPGTHAFELEAAKLAVDVVCLCRGPFTPDGPHKPGAVSRSAIDAAAAGFEFPPAGRTLELAGIWQAARWDELEVADRAAPTTTLPADFDRRPWRGVRVPGELADARPEWAYAHRYLLRTRFTLPTGGSPTLRLPNPHLLTSVFVNGRLVGHTTVPHAPTEFDLSGAARPGWNELVVVVKDHFYAVAKPWAEVRLTPPGRFDTLPLDWPVRGGRRGGLLETPTLTVTGPVAVADVFARPQPSAGRLALDVTVRNPSPAPQLVSVRPVVRPTEADGRVIGGVPAKGFAPKSVSVPAGGEAVVTFEEPWSSPRLWWPDDPVQYVAEVMLVVEGRPSDEQSVRFGVREWGTSGGRVTLNGVPWKLFAADGVPAKDGRKLGASAVSLVGDRPAEALTASDASGLPVLRSWPEDGTPANRAKLVVARTRAERNHPAIVSVPLPVSERSPLFQELPDTAYRPAEPGVMAYRLNEPPELVAAVGGEAALAGDPAATKRVARMLAEGARWAGQAAVKLPAPDPSWSPVAVLVREWDHVVPSGQPLTRTLKLLNDTRSGTPLTVHWLFRVGATEFRDKRVAKLPPGGSEEFTLTLATPPGERRDADLVLSVEREGREVFRDIRRFTLLGPPPAVEPSGVAVYDPAGRLPGFVGIPRVADPFSVSAAFKVLVVGPDAVTQTQATDPRWKSLAAAGRRLVVFDQTHPLHGPAVPAELAPSAEGGRFAFPDDHRHPAFEGLKAGDFACWANGHTVYRGAYRQPGRGATALVSCDVGLEFAAVVEVPVGEGRMLLSQLAIRDHPTDPVARRVAANLVRYAAAERSPKPLTLLLPPGPKRELLAGSGLSVRETELEGDGVALVDGTQLAAVEAAAERFVAGGGWLVAWGVTAESLPAFNRLSGADHKLTLFAGGRVTAVGGVVSTRDLAAGRVFDAVVTPGRGGQPLASVGGIVRYPRGAGGVVLCQVNPVAGEPAADTARKRRLVLAVLRAVGVSP